MKRSELELIIAYFYLVFFSIFHYAESFSFQFRRASENDEEIASARRPFNIYYFTTSNCSRSNNMKHRDEMEMIFDKFLIKVTLLDV